MIVDVARDFHLVLISKGFAATISFRHDGEDSLHLPYRASGLARDPGSRLKISGTPIATAHNRTGAAPALRAAAGEAANRNAFSRGGGTEGEVMPALT